jgi:hypothetical protein
VAAVGALWTGNLDGLLTPDVAVDEITTASIDQATAGQISRVSAGSSLVGVATGEMLPYQCAVTVSLTTAMATRAGRGRFYLPPFSASSLDGGRLASAAQADVVAAVNAMWAALGGAGLSIQIYSRTAHTLTAVTGGNVGDVIDTQRRRRNKLLENRSILTPP